MRVVLNTRASLRFPDKLPEPKSPRANILKMLPPSKGVTAAVPEYLDEPFDKIDRVPAVWLIFTLCILLEGL